MPQTPTQAQINALSDPASFDQPRHSQCETLSMGENYAVPRIIVTVWQMEFLCQQQEETPKKEFWESKFHLALRMSKQLPAELGLQLIALTVDELLAVYDNDKYEIRKLPKNQQKGESNE